MPGIPVADVAILVVSAVAGVLLIRVDVREHRLPDRLTGPAALAIVVVALGGSLARGDWSRWAPMLLTGVGLLAAGYLLAVISPDAFGMGDVKLLGVIGLALGHLDPQTIVLWLLALAAASAGWLVLAPRLDGASDRSVPWRKRHVAFGPPMIVAWWLVYAVLAVAVAAARAR